MGRREDAAGRRAVREAAAARPFSNLGPRRDAQECMLVVAWSGVNDPGDDGRGHLVQRGRVTADLGLDAVPVPPFSSAEMESIMFAAKMQALRVLRQRKRPALR